ncbi:hypothetical protein KGP36_07685, partial [Patescibacteria group bacterium]|nr:hypothetical protein [Patescibacteria group bacterium]
MVNTVLTQGGTFDPDTAKRRLFGDAISALEGSSGIAPIPTPANIASSAISSVMKEAEPARQLMKAGVKLTPGQIAAQGGGLLGKSIKTLENAGESLPVVGSAIKAARERSLDQFALATANKVLAPLKRSVQDATLTGHDLIKEVERQVSEAYKNVHQGLQFVADRKFLPEVQTAIADHATYLGQADAERLGKIVKSKVVDKLFDQVKTQAATYLIHKPLPGEELQMARSELRAEARRLIKSRAPEDVRVGMALHDVNKAIGESLARTNPQAASDLRAADLSYAMQTRMEEAAARRATSEGRFTPNDLLQTVRPMEGGVRHKAFAKGDALMQGWAEAGQRVLPSSMANSGTTDRALHAAGLGALGTMVTQHPWAVGGYLSGVLPYAKPSINALNAIAAHTPVAQQLAPYALPAAGAGASAIDNLHRTLFPNRQSSQTPNPSLAYQYQEP